MNTLVVELPLVFVSGVLGSAHCLGMCGAISATMNLGTTGVRSSLVRQSLWSLGRVFTYSFLGMMCGFAAARLSEASWLKAHGLVNSMQAGFAVFAGILLVLQGLLATGLLSFRKKSTGTCLTASVFGRLLRGGSPLAVFTAGIVTGFLPCGLVYSFLALAAASASPWKGIVILLAFGLGTVPIMLVTGIGFSLATLRFRQGMLKLAAACVLLTGLLTAGRGIAFAVSQAEPSQDSKSCPFCLEAEVSSEPSAGTMQRNP